MLVLPAGDLYQFYLNGTVAGTGGVNRPVWNSWSYIADHSSTGGNFPIGTLWNDFLNATWNRFAGLLVGGGTGYQTGLGIVAVFEPGVLWSATQAGYPIATGFAPRMPLNAAICCSMRCAARGRIYTGRKFLAPVQASQVVGDELTPGFQLSWQTACNHFLDPLSIVFGGVTWTLRPVIWSRLYSTFQPTGNVVVGDYITSVHVPKTLSSWRHRRERTVR
jgi:hypothetical protein